MWRRTKRILYTAGVGFGGYYAYKSYQSFNDQIIANWSAQYANATAPTRQEHKARLKSEEFDVLVIGGGATGTGVALDAATRGLKVALVEREDFASGASSRSTKLLHGGIRYLEKAAKHLDYGEFKLVTEALHERTRVLKNAPHLSHPLPIVLPVRSWIDLPQFWIGLKMYDGIAGTSGMFKSYYLSHDKTVTVFPTINPQMLKCSLVYYDGQMNDARLNVTLALTAASHGASVVNHTEVVSLIKKPNPHHRTAATSSSEQPPAATQLTATSSAEFTPAASDADNTTMTPLGDEVALKPSQTEVPTDSGIENNNNNTTTNTPRTPAFVSPAANFPPVKPSPPPLDDAPDTPIDKAIESIKTWVMGSSKNKQTEVGGPHLLDENILAGAVVKDNLTGEVYEIHAKVIINATGAFADSIRNMDTPVVRPLVAGSEGTHVILPSYLCPQNLGFIDAKSPDGRVVFLLPFENHTLVGTTDSPCPLTFTPRPPEDDINFILDQVRSYLHPDIKIKRSDVLAAWSGIRPLALDPHSHNTAEVSRNHVIHVDKSGLVSIVGGKWTTYRKMAEETVEKAVESSALQAPHKSHTEKLPLWGAHKYKPTEFITLMQNYGLEQDVATHLAHSYGDKAFAIAEIARKGYGRRIVEELPYLEAEVVYSVNEYAETTVDVIARRTRLAFLDNEKTKAAIPKVVDLLASQLGWDEARKQRESSEAYAFLETMK